MRQKLVPDPFLILVNNPEQLLHARSSFLERGLSKGSKKVNFFPFWPYVTCMSLVCTRMSSVCHSHVLVCHLYLLVCHPCVTRMPLACTCMSSICHSYVLTCHSYVTRLWFYQWKIGKFESVWIFEHYRILIIEGKKDRNHYDLKDIENTKNAKIAWIA